MTNQLFKPGILVAAITLSAFLGGCGSGSNEATPAGTEPGATAKATGSLTIDGSSTVFPIVNTMGEDFRSANPDVQVTVNKSGTGSGMQKFARNEVDIATASRPIDEKEIAALKTAGIDFIEVPLAYDGVCLIVNNSNAIDKISPEELEKAWNDGSAVSTWADIRAGWPAEKVNFYGPTSNHGTYEYFTEAINKKKNAIRKDYQANQDYNVVVTSVAGDRNGIGYVGFNYYAENKDKIKILPVDSGKGPVSPSEATITDGTYTPLSRPLFLYINKKTYDSKPQVKLFVDFALGESGMKDVAEAKYVPLPKEALDAVKKHLEAGKLGSLFQGVQPGMSIQQVLSKESAGN